MVDPRVTKLANLLVNYCVDVQPGEWVAINCAIPALPLGHEVYRAVIKAGGNPTVNINDDAMQYIGITEASEAQLVWISPIEKLVMEQVDVRIGLGAASNTRALSHVDPARLAKAQGARRSLMGTFMQRSASGALKWTGTQFPTNAAAQEAEMSLAEYEEFFFKAVKADKDDPTGEWMQVAENQKHIVEWLKGKKQMVVRSANCDLTLSIDGRTFVSADGKSNMPDGEIFTGPVEESVNGWVRFTFPAISGGRSVEGVELKFEQGKVVKATATKNEEFLLSQLDVDEGARYLGEFAIGTNFGIQQFTGSTLFDEKIGGTIHMAVGAGYPETGSKNQSSLHWDMVCDMRDGGEIVVDGELFYKDGQFVVSA